jgi:hypothetical protein
LPKYLSKSQKKKKKKKTYLIVAASFWQRVPGQMTYKNIWLPDVMFLVPNCLTVDLVT